MVSRYVISRQETRNAESVEIQSENYKKRQYKERGCRMGPPLTWTALAGPEDHNSEVKLYDNGIKEMLAQEMEHFSASKARGVARTA